MLDYKTAVCFLALHEDTIGFFLLFPTHNIFLLTFDLKSANTVVTRLVKTSAVLSQPKPN